MMKAFIVKGLSFGLASGIVTTLGLMVGLFAGTKSTVAVLGGILTIAIADALSDAFGIHLSEKSQSQTQKLEIWEATFATLFAKLVFALTFVVPVLLFELQMAVYVSIVWGLFLLALISMLIAGWRKESKLKMIAEHWGIAVVVVILSYLAGYFIEGIFNSMSL